MTLITKTITLTQDGGGSGPTYLVEYSLDGGYNYTASIDCTNAFLPNVSSSVNCSIDSLATNIRLTSLNSICNNSVADGGTTTTTTSTTTTTCPPCINYTLSRFAAGTSTVVYTDCYDTERTHSWESIVLTRICAKQIISITANATATNSGNCEYLPSGIICGVPSLDNCDCNNNTIAITGNNTKFVYYLECETGVPTATELSYFNPTSVTDCMVSGSIIVPGASTFSLTKLNDCDCITTTTTTTTAGPTTTTTAAPTTTTTAAPTTTTTTTAAPTTTTTTAAATTTTTTAAPCTLTIYFDVSQSPGTQGWNSSTDACQGTGTPLTVYFSNTPNGCPTTFQDVFNDGKAIYTNAALTTVLAGNDKYYKSVSAPNSGIAIQVGNDGFIDTLSGPC